MFADAGMTAVFAFFFGLFMVAAGIGLVLDPKLYDRFPEELRNSGLLGYIAAIVVFTIGAFTIALHNDWSSWLAVLVSLIGWAALIEGVLMLAVRRGFAAIIARINYTPLLLRSLGIFTVGLGILYLAGAYKA
ncbi:MAG: hypothetical protein GC208_06335 [Alphaproteobacteria bacterium]|nr:hypothetical protein [Alphaproteobacteria bacterium]